jgi:hypothetical protein
VEPFGDLRGLAEIAIVDADVSLGHVATVIQG